VMRIKIYRSKVSIKIFTSCLQMMGAEIIDRGIARLPHGGFLFFWVNEEDSGLVYSYDISNPLDVKFIQRVFSKANLENMKDQPQSQSQKVEAEEKEERKKDTDEVSEFISGTSDSVHGGDSASGEVPEGESGGGQGKPSSSHALSQQETGSMEEGSALPSDSPSLSPDASPQQGEGESGASDRSKLERASEGEGSSEDGACPKSSECASPLRWESGDASRDGQASLEEGTGSIASCPAPEDILNDILSEDGLPQGEETRLDGEPRESSTVPSPSGADVEGEAPEPEREVSPSLSFKELRKIMDRGKSVPSVHSRYSFGGIFADLESQGIPPKELINRARRVFARLVSEFGEGNEGPRWDYKRVSTRIASYQSWQVSDRKKEVGRPAIAVLPDVSGSMSSFANQVIELSKVLMALGVPGAEVIIIVQSNGYPLELWVNGEKIESRDYYHCNNDSNEVYNWYEEVFRRWNVKVVVLTADWDGAWLYYRVAENMDVKIYWLDVYLSSKIYPTLVKRFPPERGWLEGLSITAYRKIRYVYGCRDALDFVKGLELAVKR